MRRQVAIGIDIISDGETSKIGYATYIKDRLTGFEGDSPRQVPRRALPAGIRAVRRDPAAAHGAREVFMNAASPGVVSAFQPNRYFPTHAAYVEAIGEAMRTEYEAIANAGFILQLDCPISRWRVTPAIRI